MRRSERGAEVRICACVRVNAANQAVEERVRGEEGALEFQVDFYPVVLGFYKDGMGHETLDLSGFAVQQ